MSDTITVGPHTVLRWADDDPIIAGERDANDLLGAAMGAGARVIALPVGRLDPAFFDLRSGLAGALAQKAVNYRRTLAIVGGIADHLAASNALRDWVRETNKGDDVWFLPDFAALAARLA